MTKINTPLHSVEKAVQSAVDQPARPSAALLSKMVVWVGGRPANLRSDFKDLTGRKINMLTFIEPIGKLGNRVVWKVRCDCGNVKFLTSNNILSGSTVSCGCYGRKMSSIHNRTHGMNETPEWEAWSAMKDRCCNPKHRFFNDYGGRGITVCERWKLFENFYADMGKRPPGLSLDRIDNNAGYFPGNCRWATYKEQQRNRRSNHLVTINGITKCISAWAEEAGIHKHTIRGRLMRGWKPEDAVYKPLQQLHY